MKKYIITKTLGLNEKGLSTWFATPMNIPENILAVKKLEKKVSAKVYFQKIEVEHDQYSNKPRIIKDSLFYIPLTAGIKKYRNQKRRLFLYTVKNPGETLTLTNANDETNHNTI